MGGLLSKKKKKYYDIKGDRYVHEKLLAEGGFSFVYLVHQKAKGKDQSKLKFALKRISIQTQELRSLVLSEIEAHQAINHHNVMQLIGYEIKEPTKKKDTAEAWLLFPYISQGSLFDIIQPEDESKANAPPTTKRGSSGQSRRSSRASASVVESGWPYAEREALRIFRDLCQGVQAMHATGRAHRDIKPHNVLMSGDQRSPTPILIDLGSNSALSTTVTSRQQALTIQEEVESTCTRPYRPPELYDVKSDCIIDGKTDVWMLGCTLYALLFGRCPFEDPIEGVLTLWIMSATIAIPDNRSCHGVQYSEDACELIRRMLRLDPDHRPTIDEAMKWAGELAFGQPLPADSNKRAKKGKKKSKRAKGKKGENNMEIEERAL